MIAAELAEKVLAACRARRLRLTTVESCTGGLIAAALTDIPGSSDVVECGFITYSGAAKVELVGVPGEILLKYGAVSREAALAMAEGGIRHGNADIAVAVTGIAGPASRNASKPVGLVHFAIALKGTKPLHYEAHFGDLGRQAVRRAAVKQALKLVLQKLGQE